MTQVLLTMGPRETAEREIDEADADAQRLRASVRDHYDFVWRLARRLGLDDAAAEDCAQQAFLVLSGKLSGVAVESERPFLFGAATRIAKDTLRRAKRRRERPLEEADPNARSEDAPDAQLERARARAWLDQVLDKMDHDLRAVFVLYELEGMNTPQVAELTGVPLGTAASRLRRAREAYEQEVGRLRAGLQRREGGHR